MAPIVGKLLNTVGYTTGRGTDGWDTDLEPSLRKLDALVQGNAIAFVNTLPAPVEGATYIIGTSPTGIAAGWANRVVRANAFAGTWDAWVPAVGWRIAVGADDYRWNGTAWIPTGEGYFLPIRSSANVPFSNFGGVGAITANSYGLQPNKGVALADARGLNWRGGFVATDAFWGFAQAASLTSSLKPFVLSDHSGTIWYKNDPLASIWKHEFYGITKFQNTVAMAVPIAGTNADLDFRSSDALRRMTVRWNVPSNQLEIFSSNDAGTAVATRIALPRDSASPVLVGLGMNIASGALQMGGTDTISSAREGKMTKFAVSKSTQATITNSPQMILFNNDDTWGASTWLDSGGNKRVSFLQGDAAWTDRYTFGRNGEFSAVSAKIGTLAGLIAATSGVLRAAISSDFPGVLNALSQLANGNGFLRNSGAGVVTWEAAIPAPHFSPLQITNFGGTGVNGRAYQVANNYGVGFQDARGLSWRGGLFNTDAFWGLAQDASVAGSFKPMVFKDGASNVWYKLDPNDINYKHYFKGRASFDDAVDIASGSLQLGGVDTITATREGRFTGLRLTNLSSGQIPVSSDGNGQITASGLTDDGTFFCVSRVLRMWNSMARSGNTWTDLQWTQDVNERVSILSSNSSGQYAYHSWVFVPPDAEAAGRVLGGTIWGQKVSGKSGTAPGLKAGMYAKAVGSGGSTGGFGGQIVCNYRPDNGASQTDALKIGAFGGGVADAVQADILLRAMAGVQSDFIRLGVETQSESWSPSATTKRVVRQTGAGTITFPVSCAAFAGMEFVIEMVMTSVAIIMFEKDTHGASDRFFFRATTGGPWSDVYAGANQRVDGRLPLNGATSGETSAVRVRCDGNYWWIECD